MSINIENLNSGDKFLLTMTDLERTEMMISKGYDKIGYFKDIQSLMEQHKNSPKLFFSSLGLEAPKNITIEHLYLDINYGCATLDFYLSYKMITNKEIKFRYIINFMPSAIKNEKFESYVRFNSIILEEIPNKFSKCNNFKYIYSFDDNINLMQNLNNIEKYYINQHDIFIKIANAINNNEFNQYFDFWNYNKDEWNFGFLISEFPSFYLKFVDYGIDYNTFVGIKSFLRFDNKQNYLIIKEALDLMNSGKIQDGLDIIYHNLEKYKNQYILGEKQQVNELKAKIDKCKKKIAKYTSKLAKEAGIHESFITNGWNNEHMPDNLMDSVSNNLSRIKNKI